MNRRVGIRFRDIITVVAISIPLIGACAVTAFSTGLNRENVTINQEDITDLKKISSQLQIIVEHLEKNDSDKEHRLRSLEHETPHSSQERVS